MTGISLSGLDKGSKLILIGDWYLKPGKGWYVACYYLDKNNEAFRRGMPVDLLPALTPGTIYPRVNTENKVTGYTGTFKVPAMDKWQKYTYAQLPKSLKRLHEFSDQIDGQVIYRLEVGERSIWLPAIELARMLFFHSSEVVRAAVYQGNTWQLARADHEDWVGEVAFTSNVPINYLNSLQFRKFFAWLLFDVDAEESFCSIFDFLNRNTVFLNNNERWTFDFKLPDLSSCEISWSGFTGNEDLEEKHHCYIREIRAISGVTSPELEAIIFSHPDDILFLENESQNDDDNGDKPGKRKPKVTPKEIDPHNPPNAAKKRWMVHISSAGFHFDTEIDLRRSPRQIRALPKGGNPELDESQEEDTVGIVEGSDHGKSPRADIDNLEKPELIDAPEKIAFFRTMLEQLECKYEWDIETHIGDVPKKRCRSLHSVDNRPRKYCHAIIQLDETTLVQVLEIELKANESLSTLFFRAVDTYNPVEQILDALMTGDSSRKLKSMQWKRKINTEKTTARHYLDHPDKKIKSEAETLESWVARAAFKILNL